VAVFAPYLLDFQQQDSQEFLRFLLDGMSEDLCRRRVRTVNNSICSPVTSTANHDPHHDKPQSSGSASTQGRLSAKSAQQQQQSILPMLPGATIERLVTPPQRSESPHTTSTLHGSVSETTEGVTLMMSPRYNSVQKLRMETRAMQEATNQQQLSQQHHHQSPQHADDATGAIELSAKLRISREIGAARKVVSDDSVIGISSSNSANNNVLDTNGNNNNKLNPVNFAETAPASLGSMLQTGEINPANDGRVESAPSTARVTHTPSFSRQLRDVMTGKTLRLRRDRVNSANSRNINDSGEDGGSERASTHSDGGEGNSCTLTPVNVEEEATKAWDRYLKFNDSIITDIFGGLLQSTVQCLTCQHRSYAFDPFLDLSVPIHRDGEGTNKGLFSTIRQVTNTSENRSTLEKCLEKFTSEEVLDGDNMVKCDRCNKPRKSIKQLSIFRYPKILVVHIKRFRFNNFSREKLSTDVHFPMTGLDLCGYLSHDRPKSLSNLQSNNNNEGLLTQREQQQQEELSPMPASSSPSLPHLRSPKIKASMNPNLIPPAIVTNTMVRPVSGEEPPPIYDLIGVSNHHGTLNGGHYVAHVDTDYGRSQGRSPRWVCFNDARVSLAQAAHIAGPTAYVLFYKLRDDVHI
jgi:ubiquitin C-terminal hydrolase